MIARSALPTSLTRRFALAAAGLAAGALLLTALASWWVLKRQHEDAVNELVARERQFHAQAVSQNITALAERMREVAGSTILATGLVDSAGRETYLQPFLEGIRQVNGIPVNVLFTDFEGSEIASNQGSFSDAQRAWLRQALERGQPSATVFRVDGQTELLALEPLIYPRTATPEGALLYKVALDNIYANAHVQLLWGPNALADETRTSRVDAPPIFSELGFRVAGSLPVDSSRLSPQYLPIFGLALALFVAVVLAGVRLASVLTRDLRQLQLFARDLVRDGLSQERVQATGTEEVASLAASINQMLDRLYEQRTALTREGQKLVDLADALKRADKRKDEFVAMLAHELRNPLAPIMTGAQTLARGTANAAVVEQTGRIIGNQAKHMARIIDDLLDISRITRGQVTLKLATLDFAKVVRVAVEQIRPLIEASQHSLSISLPPGRLPVRGDSARLVQIVSNLLNNAAKYTPEGGRIELQVETTGAELRLRVSDNGHGIDPELMPEIFDLFIQGERSSDRSQGGLGLGLALVRSLTQMHGGRVSAQSQGLGHGASFSVHLPCARLDDLPDEEAAPALASELPARQLSLHLVDDNADAVQTLATLLALDGYRVSVSLDALSTLDLLNQRRQGGLAPPDVFLLDIGLPDMDGNELARALRAHPETRACKLVALTGYGQASDRERSKEAGFDHHLVKPIEYEQLFQLLERFKHTLALEPIQSEAAALQKSTEL